MLQRPSGAPVNNANSEAPFHSGVVAWAGWRPHELFVFVIIITSVCAFYALTIRPGHIWGDDFAMYIMHARNIATGSPFEETGYIYNPAFPEVGPRAYPPLFPLMLSFVYRFFGLNLTAMKIEVILCFIASLFLSYRLFRTYVSFSFAVIVLLVLALNPYFWGVKDNIGADLPFLFVCYLTLYLTEICDRCAWKHRLYNSLLAVGLYLSFAMRTIGIILLPAVIVFAVIRMRRVPGPVARVILVAALLIFAHMLLFHGAASYADQLGRLTVPRVLKNAGGYFWEIRHVLWSAPSPLPGLLLSCVLIALGAAGWLIRIFDNLTILDVFGPLYIVTVIAWATDEDLRFLIPVIPLWVFYITVALRRMWVGRSLRLLGKAFTVLMLFAIGVSYAHAYAQANWGPIQEGLGDPQFQQVCAYIRSSTPPGSVLIFRKPRVLALATSRKAACALPSAEDKELASFLNEVHADYIVLAPQFDDYAVLTHFIRANQSRTRKVFRNSEFQVLELQRAGASEPWSGPIPR